MIWAVLCKKKRGGLIFTKRQNIRLVQIQSICRQQNKCDVNIEICFGKGRKHCGKMRKCLLPALSLFPSMFSKVYFFRVNQSGNYMEKSLICIK